MSQINSHSILHPVDRLSPSDLADIEFRPGNSNDWGNSKILHYHKALEAAEKQIVELQKQLENETV